MRAILKRELSAYFCSAAAYVTMAVFFLFSGLFFFFGCFAGNNSDLGVVFSNMFYVILFVIPIITMKSFAEERRQKTDQALLCSPTSLTSIVMGKFLGAFVLYLICTAIFVVYAVVISFFTTPQWSVFLCTMIGIILLGAAVIAINIFISAMTESMIVSAIFGMAVGFVLLLMNSFVSLVSVDWLATALNKLNFISYYVNFSYGMLSAADLVFFVSVTALFVFFTVRALDKRRWS